MIRRKKNSVLLGIFLLSVSIWGCKNELDQIAQTSVTDQNFWKTPNDLALGCNYLYTFLPALAAVTDAAASGATPIPPYPVQDVYSDIGSVASGTLNEISDGSRSTAPAMSTEWTYYYRLIRAANNIIEKAAGVTGDASAINRYRGEARFFRAFAYFELTKRFGDVPLLVKTLTTDDPQLFGTRTARETIIDSVYADLDFSAKYCPQPDLLTTTSGNEYGRITRSAALAFKSRVGLFEGTRQKYTNMGTPAKHLQIALDASNTVITEGKHSLFSYAPRKDSSFFYLFQYAGETYTANKEVILARLYGQNITNSISPHSYGRGVIEQGALVATRAYMDMVLFKDGLPAGKSAFDSTAIQTSTLTEYRNRDPRLGMTIFRKGDYYGSSFTPYFIPTTAYRIKKYYIAADWVAGNSYVDFMVLRYGEVLLNYAEATFELNGSISDADLNKTVNALRNRATNNQSTLLPPLTNAFASANGLDMKTELRRERTVELAYEGFRYWDLIRWKTAETALPQALIGPKYFPKEYATGTAAPALQDGYVLYEAAAKRTFNISRDYLWPLPVNELGLNPNLGKNNPGW
ncbi:RagB/SusD family nutrient uptake outer membrane protein [Spirosoma foliorum]|uniref:RagB/SusD family nutrient uptake outer membrane protein n=1 Tax=Spirosoma foliorum TaxID=2710596 RepID=A0A7G5GR88_9BACT|nr:RagB/SusD family nutrient uptake outer membrane protein [Spirosoma foliorum]QMW01380.1 RagB/SusD family nutrient uptake outer membrane protein [Spirosoma foliorum]